jgi:hypothetical protein
MTLTINLKADIEADLEAQARAQGVDLPEYVEHVLREQVPPRAGSALSPAEPTEAWRESTHDLPHTPPLSDDAISRGSIYGDYGGDYGGDHGR